ncbi:hypothetical protein Vretimale_11158 [Volvox reticuliferus]|uniref:Branched-chain-amino-acid aminotransferase n=1 Tax=Volvox reticuliferus TaxID=1737510 RepID=A0A8J4LRR4_9CHLO|nr:hypothetical protein Vretifemale_12057 [Volvox reticuliferus]GIM06916.1 hypothetical protein Vretimale_11158 [Volvox reticuliferus]
MAPSSCVDAGAAAANAGAATAGADSATGTGATSPAAASHVDWSRVRLGVDAAPTMFIANWSPDTCRWDGGELVPYGPLTLLPAAQVLNYGQSIFEGLKAYRFDGGSDAAAAAAEHRVLLFRPDANAARFEAGARRMCMPPVPSAMFLAAVQAVARANAAWVPPPARGSLYIRPLLLGTGPLLGLCPAPSYTFLVYAVPVGGRAKEGRLVPLDYLIHESRHRAAPRGVGSTKAAGNYSPCLLAQAEARAQGCHDCIYLDAKSDTYLEEGSGCNVFMTRGSVVTTPPAAGSILPGITRASLLQLAAALGYAVREAPISWKEALQADEMFGSGTALVVQPIRSVTFKGRRVMFCRTSSSNGTSVDDGESAANGHANEHANGNGQANGHANGCYANCNGCVRNASSDSSDNGEVEVETEKPTGEDEGAAAAAAIVTVDDSESESAGLSYDFGGKTAAELQPKDRAALASFAPVPELASLPPGVGPIAHRLYSLLTGIQYGRAPDPFGWMVEVDMRGPTAGPLHLDQLLACEEAKGVSEHPLLTGKGLRSQLQARPVFADPNLE